MYTNFKWFRKKILFVFCLLLHQGSKLLWPDRNRTLGLYLKPDFCTIHAIVDMQHNDGYDVVRPFAAKRVEFMTVCFLVRYFLPSLPLPSRRVSPSSVWLIILHGNQVKKSPVINCSISLRIVKHVQCLCAKREHCERYKRSFETYL